MTDSKLTSKRGQKPPPPPPATGPSAPSLMLALLEGPRVLSEVGALLPARGFLQGLNPGDGHTVMTLPGFMASDRSTSVLRRYLRHWGYEARRWDLGRNLGVLRDGDIEHALDERLLAHYEASGGKVSLVGWSLGGLFAREMARRQPELVRSVITLGSPLGDPRATNAWRLFELVSGRKIDDEEIQARIDILRQPLPAIPMTAIYSKSDAIVSWRIARLPPGDRVESIRISASHLGMGFNPAVLYVIADRLRQADGEWRPFEFSGVRRFFYH
jgi:pimeloyl-ACP methyl ester carboxylesterase